MEAKDTVMSDEELARIWATFEPHRHFVEHIAEAQAEISFKAGEEQERGKIKEELVKIAKTIKDNKAGALFLAQTRTLRQTLKAD